MPSCTIDPEYYRVPKVSNYPAPGKKDDKQKPRFDLIPAEIELEIANVLTYGAEKYGENNWQGVAPKERYLAAARRHLNAWQQREKYDVESKLPHLAHAICSLMFLLWLDERCPKSSS